MKNGTDFELYGLSFFQTVLMSPSLGGDSDCLGNLKAISYALTRCLIVSNVSCECRTEGACRRTKGAKKLDRFVLW